MKNEIIYVHATTPLPNEKELRDEVEKIYLDHPED